MAGSSEKVDYNVRTSKSIERKMMCELLSRLPDIQDYRYIGMGAKFFTDFVLMHKQFGITEMYSLETKRSAQDIERFKFNVPFNCINIDFQNTSEWLHSTSFKWKKKKDVIWFDYDGGLSLNQVEDVSLCFKKIDSLSVVFVSTNVSFLYELRDLSPKDRLEKYTSIIGDDSYTKHLTVKDLAGDNGAYRVIADTFNTAIHNVVSDVNSKKENPNNMIEAKQIAYFKYSDSFTPMITMGWVVTTKHDATIIDSSGLEKLPFYKKEGEVPFDITVPIFTYKELAVLNKNMPNYSYPIDEAKFFTEDEVRYYSKIYKYYPTTIETGIVL